MKPRELTAEEERVYVEAGIPLELVGVLTPEEEAELERFNREDHEKWLEEHRFVDYEDWAEHAWAWKD